MSVLAIARGDRRLEAATYLSEGRDLRKGFVESGKEQGWQKLGTLARVWQPARLKGIIVDREFGTPFLAATQVFDVRPSPRKWLSLDRTDNSEARFVTPGLILVTCSGSVGRATLAYAAHERILISHDLLRVTLHDESRRGWIYAFLRSPQGRAMMTGEQYGHIIKHLEPEHLNNVPVPDVTDRQAAEFEKTAQEILDDRNASYRSLIDAERLYAKAIGPLAQDNSTETGFSLSVSALLAGRRRLEANYHSRRAASVLDRFRVAGTKVEPLGKATDRIWMMDRFKRNYGASGIPYLSADELFTLNPEEQKRIMAGERDSELYFAKPNWLLMARSGQIYGLNGSVYLVTNAHNDTFFSDDLIRISPRAGGPRAGYIATALSHPSLGRPLLMREAYGTSIPHLDPVDVAAFPLVRLKAKIEDEIADLVEGAAVKRGEADVKERKLAADAGAIVAAFLAKSDTTSMAV